jgi:hypothetical protein
MAEIEKGAGCEWLQLDPINSLGAYLATVTLPILTPWSVTSRTM